MKNILKVYAGKKDIKFPREGARRFLVRFDQNECVITLDYSCGFTEDITAQYELSFGDRRIATSQPRISSTGSTHPHAAYRSERPLKPGPHHYVVQFIGPIKQNWLMRIRATGAKLREPRGNFAYIIWAKEPMVRKVAGMSFVRWLGHLSYKDRIAPQVLGKRTGPKLPRRRERPGVYTVEIFSSEDAGRIARACRSLGFEVISQEPKARLLLLRTEEADSATARQVEKLSEVHGVRFVRQRVVPRPSNNVATTVMGNDYTARAPGGLKLAGPFVERLIGTLPREYFDHILFWTKADLENKLLVFRTYFNNHRTHDSLEGRTLDTSVSRPITNLRSIRWQPHCRTLYQTPVAT